jgi:hypothetical protein
LGNGEKKSAAALSWEGWGAAAVLFLGFPEGVSPDLFSFLTGFAGFLGLTESRPLGKVENRKLGRAEDRLTEGWPEGRSIGDDASQRLPQGSSEGGAGREILRIN